MHRKHIVHAGAPLATADKVLILLHGRGAGPNDILGLAGYFPVAGFALLAPAATNSTWYPYSFMAPETSNEPWLSSAVDLVTGLIDELLEAGKNAENLYFMGFSQGACLLLECLARHAQRYGGAAAFTGGLIGESLQKDRYKGDFAGMPLFLGTSDPDPHVPVLRVEETAGVYTSLQAAVTKKIYPGMGHTINQDELTTAGALLFK
ncbi:alpha/beta hydrolase [Flavihumibacter petaseus]|uniref:Putative hydrolase n=1 Tax=Flavihumibacter petaseus NBRC 106054 TaxID=1220578 RepID=A0A0E9MVX3_9BACT|nr:dienelactone hydrolase family protein [Flavihumibacter petaseus]GAO41872.1 putative hydrolase [Flavihumibacter petaseus NBRC 106054]